MRSHDGIIIPTSKHSQRQLVLYDLHIFFIHIDLLKHRSLAIFFESLLNPYVLHTGSPPIPPPHCKKSLKSRWHWWNHFFLVLNNFFQIAVKSISFSFTINTHSLVFLSKEGVICNFAPYHPLPFKSFFLPIWACEKVCLFR